MTAKRILLPGLLVLALAGVALLLRGKGRLPATPDEAVRALFQAAQRGDASAYLALLADPPRSSFEATQAQVGGTAFAANLRDSVSGVKGFSVVSSGEPGSERAELEVELVFADRNQRQRFVLVRQRGGWLVGEIGTAETIKPPIPYGAPVFDTGE